MPAFGVYPIADVLTAGDEVSSTYEGRHVTLLESELIHPSHADGFVNKGDPVVFGTVALQGVGVAFTSAAAATDYIAIDTEGIWILDVVASDDDGGVDVDGGDRLYISITTAVVSKISSTVTNVPFGYALGHIDSGSTETIAVKVHYDPIDNWVVDDELLYFGDAKGAWLTPSGDSGHDGILAYAAWTAAGATGRTFESQLAITGNMGSYVNAMKAYIDASAGGSTGLLSAFNAEMKMPTGACAGAFYNLEIEWVGQAGTSFSTPGTGSQSGLIFIGCTGTVTDLDSDGVFMSLNGLTPAIGKLHSADMHTLRCTIDNGDYTKYMLFSTAENYLNHSFSVIAADDRIFKLSGDWATPANTDGEGIINLSANVTGIATGETNLKSSWINFGTAADLATLYGHINTDGFYGSGSADLATAFLSHTKFSCMVPSTPRQLNIMEIQFATAFDQLTAIYSVNNPALCLGFVAGTSDDAPTGSIPFFQGIGGGGGMKYIRTYDGPIT